MIDFDKPIRTRDGREVTIVTTNLTRDIAESLSISEIDVDFDNDSVLAIIDGKHYGFLSSGRYNPEDSFFGETEHDLVNYTPRTSEFRTFRERQKGEAVSKYSLGAVIGKRLGAVSGFLRDEHCWEGVLELIREDGKLVDVKFHPPEDTE